MGLRFGIQRKIFGKNFIDIQAGPQFLTWRTSFSPGNNMESKNNFWGFSTRVRMGLVLGKKNLSLNAGQKCNVFQCFEERQKMFKVDFLNLLSISITDFRRFSGKFILSYEHKFNSFWSINSELSWIYLFLNSNNNGVSDSKFNYAGLRLKLQGRYYYDMKKRIARGKSANNLSGNYFGLQLNTSDLITYSTSEIKGVAIAPQFALSVGPMWGLQRTIFGRWFIDYSIGTTLNIYLNDQKSVLFNYDQEDFSAERFNLTSQLRIGLFF